MAEHFTDKLRKKLKPGYSLVQVQEGAGKGVFEVRDEKGAPIVDEASGAPIRFGDQVINQRGVEATLRRLGAIPPPKERVSRPQSAAVPHEKKVSNPILMARDILADSQATPRERRIAKAFLSLLGRHEEVRELAKKLGQRLSEYQAAEKE